MCVYCYCGDLIWKYNPPYWPKPNDLVPDPIWPGVVPSPYTPAPYIPPAIPENYPNPAPNPTPPADWKPWNLEKLKEYKKLLEDIKALEDSIGCPCEPNKADHIKILEDRIKQLETENTTRHTPLKQYTIANSSGITLGAAGFKVVIDEPVKKNPNCKCNECKCEKKE